jgi:hypothetical protein
MSLSDSSYHLLYIQRKQSFSKFSEIKTRFLGDFRCKSLKSIILFIGKIIPLHLQNYYILDKRFIEVIVLIIVIQPC